MLFHSLPKSGCKPSAPFGGTAGDKSRGHNFTEEAGADQALADAVIREVVFKPSLTHFMWQRFEHAMHPVFP